MKKCRRSKKENMDTKKEKQYVNYVKIMIMNMKNYQKQSDTSIRLQKGRKHHIAWHFQISSHQLVNKYFLKAQYSLSFNFYQYVFALHYDCIHHGELVHVHNNINPFFMSPCLSLPSLQLSFQLLEHSYLLYLCGED